MAFSGIRGLPMSMDTRAEEHSGRAALGRLHSNCIAPMKHQETNGAGLASDEGGCKPVPVSLVQQ